MRNIYNYNTDFDKDTILDKMANIEEQIQDAEDETPSADRDKKVRELIYAQFIQGLRLSTGYNIFLKCNFDLDIDTTLKLNKINNLS